MTVSIAGGQCWSLIALQYESIAAADLMQVCGWVIVVNTSSMESLCNHNVGTPVVWLQEHNFFRKCFSKSQFKLMVAHCIMWMQLVNFMKFLHRYRSFLFQYKIFNELKYCFIATEFLLSILHNMWRNSTYRMPQAKRSAEDSLVANPPEVSME